MAKAPVAHILVIEDNPADVFFLQTALDEAGIAYTLTTLSDGAEALGYLQRAESATHVVPPSLIVLDLNLPKVAGITLLEVLRTTPPFRTVPVVVLTSSESPRDQAALVPYKVTYLHKPPDLDAFLALGPVLGALAQVSVQPETPLDHDH
jgi:CheY-like chemotaxis protein